MAFQFQPFHIAHHVIVHHQSAHSQSQIFRKIGIFHLNGLRGSIDFIAQFHHIFAIKFAKLDGLILLTRCVLKGHSHGLWHDRTVFMLVGVDSSWGFKVPHNCILIIHKRQKHGIDTRHIKIRWIKIHTHWFGAVPFDEGLVVIQPIPRSVIDFCEPTFCGILDTRQKFLFITDGLFPKNLIRNFRCFDQMRDAFALRFRQQRRICFELKLFIHGQSLGRNTHGRCLRCRHRLFLWFRSLLCHCWRDQTQTQNGQRQLITYQSMIHDIFHHSLQTYKNFATSEISKTTMNDLYLIFIGKYSKKSIDTLQKDPYVTLGINGNKTDFRGLKTKRQSFCFILHSTHFETPRFSNLQPTSNRVWKL